MDSQRRFEGPDLQALLNQVQQECGEDATIIAANKLRSGGVGGFFSKERFEVIVAVDDRAVTPTPVAPAAATSAADALASALQATGSKTSPHRISTTPTVWDEPTTTQASTPAPSEPLSHLETAVIAAMEAAGEAAPAAPKPAAASILELAEQRNNEEAAQGTTAPATTVSTEKPAFAEMLGTLAREALSQSADVRVEEPFVPLAPPVIETQPAPVAPQSLEPSTSVASLPVTQPAAPSSAIESRPQPAAPAPMSPVGAALACLGLPDHLLPATHALSELRTDLVAALRWLPAADPLPTGTGSVIAVVGNADHAMTMAQQLARELNCDEQEIVVAGDVENADIPTWMQLHDIAEAADRRRSWRRRTSPTVVAVAAPLGYDPAAWAKPMLDALEPTIAWGVVSADRKSEDVRAWIDRLGGVDALALTDTTLTVSPGTMLQLGIPIARLDGDRADPMRWANLLLSRLAA